jgi:recombination protein RecA
LVVKNDAKSRVADILASASKKYNLNAGPMNQVMENVKSIPTGNISIDSITGVGGLPMGRLIEAYGPPSSGKTTMAIQAAASLQRIIIGGGDPERGITPDDLIVYADWEHAMDPAYCLKLGLDTNHPSFVFVQPDSLEDGANFLRDMVGSGLVRLTIIDSVAMMTPSAKLEAETGKPLPMLQAKLMSEFLAAYTPLLYANNCTGIFVNHIYEMVEMNRRPGLPPRTSTPGGRALKFMASLRLEFKQLQNIKTAQTDLLTQEKVDTVTSTNVAVKVVKNKVGPPFIQAIVRVRYGEGFDNFWSAMQILIANKYVMYQPGIFKFHKLEAEGLAPDWMPRMTVGTKPPALKGEKDLFKASKLHPEWRDGLIAKAQSVIDELGVEAFALEEEDTEEDSDESEDDS